MGRMVISVGPFPPPVHGMAKNLEIVTQSLEASAPVIRINTSPGTIKRGLPYHLTKLIRICKGLLRLAVLGIASRDIRFYMPPDAGFGIYYSNAFTLLARLLGAKIFLHHRSFAYINDYSSGMDWLVKVAGTSATHIFLCQEMEKQFREHYKLPFKSLIVSNAQHVTVVDNYATKTDDAIFSIGHLSNLGFDKGLKDVIELTARLISKGYNIKLILGGPPENNEAAAFLRQSIQKLGENIDYRGYITNNEKSKFYSDIDVFVFPSRYKNEAQPNVIFEANAHAVPVITLNRGCLSTDVNVDNGVVVGSSEDFVSEAAAVVECWLKSPKQFDAKRKSTLLKMSRLKKDADTSFREMITTILS